MAAFPADNRPGALIHDPAARPATDGQRPVYTQDAGHRGVHDSGFGPAHHRRFPRRGFLIGLLGTLALMCWVVAMTTPIAMIDYGDGDSVTDGSGEPSAGMVHVDAWHACNRRDDGKVAVCRPMGHPDEPCTELRDHFRVEQAFLLLTGLMLLPLLVCAALDFSHKLDANTPDLPHRLDRHEWLIFFAVCSALMSLVAFAVGFAIPHIDSCENGSLKDQPDFAWGPSPVFSLLIFILSLVMIVLAVVLRRDGSRKTKEEIKHQRLNEPVVA
jgi:hypothetical protein